MLRNFKHFLAGGHARGGAPRRHREEGSHACYRAARPRRGSRGTGGCKGTRRVPANGVVQSTLAQSGGSSGTRGCAAKYCSCARTHFSWQLWCYDELSAVSFRRPRIRKKYVTRIQVDVAERLFKSPPGRSTRGACHEYRRMAHREGDVVLFEEHADSMWDTPHHQHMVVSNDRAIEPVMKGRSALYAVDLRIQNVYQAVFA